MTFDIIDLANIDLPYTISDSPPNAVGELGARLMAADAFVVITPEYNHSFPAALKNFIDLYNVEWQKKPLGFVSYGGISGGLRAVEQLRQIFAELHVVTVRDTVSFHRAHSEFDSQGDPRDPNRVNRAASAMLDQLSWWGLLLREGRARDQLILQAQTA